MILHEQRFWEPAVESIKQDEGYRKHPYDCTEGYKTIGYGSRLPLQYSWERDIFGGNANPQSVELFEAIALLRINLRAKVLELMDRLKKRGNESVSFMALPVGAQISFSNMCYQLGVGGLLDFERMWNAVHFGKWDEVVNEMRDSLWYSQTTNRAERNIARIEGIIE